MSDFSEQTLNPGPGSVLDQIAAACGGTAALHTLTDESGNVVHSFATMSLPLRKDHWIYQKDDTPDGFNNVPPMPFRMGSECTMHFAIDGEDVGGLFNLAALKINKCQFEKAIRAAGKYAVRCATINGSEMDFDPDALLQNLVVGFLGYWTETGLTADPEDSKWCDPQEPFNFTIPPPRNLSAIVQEATGSVPSPAPGSSEA
jgi:hypothetical protein